MIETAKKAARAAGEILTKHYGKIPKEAIREKSKNDFLSFVDEASEKTIISIISEKFPDHSILAEESGQAGQDNPYRWIIDPLDGTKNYITGIPVFAVSIALQYKDELIAGVIYEPLRDELFWAEKGKGAFLNDQLIHVSAAQNLEQSFLATGFPFKTKNYLHDYLQVFESLFSKSIGTRRMGSAAIDLAYLAAGRFDGFWEIGLKPWDIAAGAVIITEAGGSISDFWNKPYFLNNNYLIASNGKIHSELCGHIQNHFPFYKPVYSQ